jgi:hypothetical protein
MDSMTRSSFNFLTPTMKISRGWSTRPSLSRIRSRRWTRMSSRKCHIKDSLQEATQASLASARTFLQKLEHGSLTDAWTSSSVLDAATELLDTTSEFPEAESSIASTMPKYAATTSLEFIARPSPNRSNLTERTSSRKSK